MEINGCQLVGVTDDLTQVPEASDIADYIEFRLGSAKDGRLELRLTQ